jgi:prevent-host-death family protein
MAGNGLLGEASMKEQCFRSGSGLKASFVSCMVKKHESMSLRRTPMPTLRKEPARVISALQARTHFAEILQKVERERRSFVVQKRGSPKAIILSVPDYIKLAAPEPEILRILGEESKRNGTDRLTSRQIDAEIREARREMRREREKRASTKTRS